MMPARRAANDRFSILPERTIAKRCAQGASQLPPACGLPPAHALQTSNRLQTRDGLPSRNLPAQHLTDQPAGQAALGPAKT
jgi:hypothetical protein